MGSSGACDPAVRRLMQRIHAAPFPATVDSGG
jgi:hypothetical protein